MQIPEEPIEETDPVVEISPGEILDENTVVVHQAPPASRRGAIVISWDESENPKHWKARAENVGKLRAMFVDSGNVKVISAQGLSAERLTRYCDQKPSNLVTHARNELEILGVDADHIGRVEDVLRSFLNIEDGHSGASAMYYIYMLHDLLQMKNLSPLTNNPLEWNHVADMEDGRTLYQSRRNSEAFSEDGGLTYSLNSDKPVDGVKVMHTAIDWQTPNED